LRLEILRANSVPFRGRPLMLAPGQDRDLGSIMLATAIPLMGRVLDADGAPVSGARIVARATVTGAGPGHGVPDGLYAVSDREGTFIIPLAAGDHAVTASLANHADVQAAVRVGPGPAPPLTLRFGRPSASVPSKAGPRRRP
jgi:hypothetical protein